MKHITYNQDGIEYDYYRINPYEMFKTIRQRNKNITPFSLNYQYCESVKLKDYNKKYNYKIIHASFDIETTSINEHSYMYIWQFGYILKGKQFVCKGRTWKEFEYVFKTISNKLHSKERILVYCHNLQGYEFQFLRGRYHEDITEVFAKEHNHPIKFILFENIEFRDSMALCPKSLEKLALDYCNAKKLKGDLDYSILRNSKDILSENEERYCDNDVIILSEYSKYVFENLIINEKIPLTQTGIIRSEIIKYLKDNDIYKSTLSKIKKQFPSKTLYDLMVNYLFKGGLSNANFTIIKKILTDLDSYDFTSSYPAIMLQDRYYFPSEFTKCNITNFKDFLEISQEKCVIGIFKFKNLRATTKHNIISISKCIESEKPLVLNGRVRCASYITVFETEIDIATYLMFYKWDDVEILACYKAEKTNMPDYIRIPLLKAYVDKSILKKNNKPYATEKAKANSTYGMMVQRLIINEIEYDNNNDTFIDKPINDFNKMIKNRFILPQVGVYITAWARYNLLCGIYNYKDTTYLYDTDSIKGHFNDLSYVEKYNEEMIYYNKIISNKYNVEFEHVNDLGCWDCETKNSKYDFFMTLGAKRYIYTQHGEFKQTIAGLGKNALYNTCYKELYGEKPTNSKCNDEKTIEMCFNVFDDNMYIEDAEKLYHENYGHVTDIVNGEKMEEFSGVYLSENDFTLHLNEIFIKHIKEYQNSNLEERIL